MPRVTITVSEKSPQPYRFDLKREIVTIGRGQDNDIVVGCGSVSGKHSEMRRVEGGYELIDVGSTNGIKIDGIRHKKVVLHTGMVVKLGDVEFGFTLSEDELSELANEVEPVELPAAGFEDEDSKESKKPISKAVDEDEDDDEDDDLDKLPELPPAKKEKPKDKKPQKDEDEDEEEDEGDSEEEERENRAKAKKREEAEEAAKRKKAEKREKAEKAEKAKRRERSERAEKREKGDEYSETKAATIGSGFILFALIAVAGAFFYGASTRHEKDTGENLLKGIVNKEDAKSDAPTDVEDKSDGGTE